MVRRVDRWRDINLVKKVFGLCAEQTGTEADEGRVRDKRKSVEN